MRIRMRMAGESREVICVTVAISSAAPSPSMPNAAYDTMRSRLLMTTDFDIAGICAHPDDAELVMGGTLLREARRGRRIALVDLTRGEAGSRGTPEIREREAAEAARLLGVSHAESLGLPDARP